MGPIIEGMALLVRSCHAGAHLHHDTPPWYGPQLSLPHGVPDCSTGLCRASGGAQLIVG